MRIWLVGAGQSGVEALRQLRKNGALEVLVSYSGSRHRCGGGRIDPSNR